MENSLPIGLIPYNTCCFTGHRRIPEADVKKLRLACAAKIRELAKIGYRYFLSGGAMGFDMLAAQVVALLSREIDVHLVLILPCLDQTHEWEKMENGTDLLYAYSQIKGLAECVYYISDFYYDGCMKERNRFLIDHSSYCIAYYNGAARSGTGQTFRMAQRAGIGLVNLKE